MHFFFENFAPLFFLCKKYHIESIKKWPKWRSFDPPPDPPKIRHLYKIEKIFFFKKSRMIHQSTRNFMLISKITEKKRSEILEKIHFFHTLIRVHFFAPWFLKMFRIICAVFLLQYIMWKHKKHSIWKKSFLKIRTKLEYLTHIAFRASLVCKLTSFNFRAAF